LVTKASLFWSRGLGLECLLLKEPRFFRASKGRSWGGANDTGVIPVRVALVLYRIDPHFSAKIGASWDGKVETIKSFSALSEVPGSACAQSGMDFGKIMRGIETEVVNVPFHIR
jgi:hypothetical protein